jgi:translation initiation factor 2B subunit (eIF-2B alpha/beta/delta family)
MGPAEIPDLVRRGIVRIRSDHRSGSAALTRNAGEVLSLLAGSSARSREAFKTALETTCRLLVDAQPVMAPLVNLSNAALLAGDRPSRVKSAVSRFLKGMDAAGRAVSASAASLLGDGATVMTHSSSETVRRALIQAARAGRRLRVIVTESRPLYEGRAMAEQLGEAGIPVVLIADAALLALMPEADLVMVGADALTSRFLVNKAGTSLAALAARSLGKRFYALAGSEKFVPAPYRLPQEPPKPPAELLKRPPANVTVRNLYFDATPLAWLTGIVTERGVLRPAELRPLLRRMTLHPALSREPREQRRRV